MFWFIHWKIILCEIKIAHLSDRDRKRDRKSVRKSEKTLIIVSASKTVPDAECQRIGQMRILSHFPFYWLQRETLPVMIKKQKRITAMASWTNTSSTLFFFISKISFKAQQMIFYALVNLQSMLKQYLTLSHTLIPFPIAIQRFFFQFSCLRNECRHSSLYISVWQSNFFSNT